MSGKYRHKGEKLNACNSDLTRAQLCVKWAEEARDAWYEGKLEASDRRGINGEYEWSKSVKARDLVGLEQMYCRWAMMYFAKFEAQVQYGRLRMEGMRETTQVRAGVPL